MNGNMNSLLRHPLTRLHCLLIVLAALAVVVLPDGVVSAAPRQQTLSSDNTLSSLSLSDVTLGATFDPSVLRYASATAASTLTETTVTATPTDSSANVVIELNRNVQSGVTVPLAFGANDIAVVVTAEDGMIAIYQVTVTRLRPIVERSIDTLNCGSGWHCFCNAHIWPRLGELRNP